MSFQLKRNLLITALILIFIAIIWLFVQSFVYLFAPSKSSDLSLQPVVLLAEDYAEKIDNFSLQNFDDKHQLLHFIEAKHYFYLKDSPTLLLDPKVSAYDKAGVEEYFLRAKRAHYLNDKQIRFIGEVVLHSKSGITHKLNTEALLLDMQTHDLSTDLPIIYTDKQIKMQAQGMKTQAKSERLRFTGKVKITQAGGQKLQTKNVYVDRSNGQQHYYSKYNTIYSNKDSKIYAGGMDMDARKALLHLIGKVKILQNSGSQIYTQDLHIDQSNGQDIYQTKHEIRYRSKIASISAKGMRYKVKRQKIKLTGGVLAHYNIQ